MGGDGASTRDSSKQDDLSIGICRPLPVKNTFINFSPTMCGDIPVSPAARRSQSEPRSFTCPATLANGYRGRKGGRGRKQKKDSSRFVSEPLPSLESPACEGPKEAPFDADVCNTTTFIGNQLASLELVNLSKEGPVKSFNISASDLKSSSFAKICESWMQDDSSGDTGTPDEALDRVPFTPEIDPWINDSSEDELPPSRAIQESRMPTWSAGAVGHMDGKCKPCAWNWKPGGCSKGESCEFCHLCEEGSLKVRRKQQQAALKTRLRLQKQHKNWVKFKSSRAPKCQDAWTAPVAPGPVPTSLIQPGCADYYQ